MTCAIISLSLILYVYLKLNWDGSSYNGSSVVDYVLAEEGIRERIVSFEVGDLQIHSDHCLLLLNLIKGSVIITGVRRQGYHQRFCLRKSCHVRKRSVRLTRRLVKLFGRGRG